MSSRGRSPKPRQGPKLRRNTVKLPADVARRVADGHPWIFADALKGRALPAVGTAVDVVDPEGRFVARGLSDPDGNPVVRVFSRAPGEPFDETYLRRQLGRSVALRRRLGLGGPRDGFRVISGDSEGIPAVTVDSYAGHLVVCCYSALTRTFERQLLQSLDRLLEPAAVYVQRRYEPSQPGQARPGGELVVGQAAPPEVPVQEGRCSFVVDVSAPASPGLFLDMWRGRQAVARLAGGQQVLNCFSYTGAFSVVAAMHGASGVVSVDASARAHGRARRNFDKNGLLRQGESIYEFVTGDTFAVLAQLADRGRRFGLVILDPPTFSSARGGRTFTALKDYAELVQAALGVVDRGGVLVACCNAVKLSTTDMDRAVGRGAARAGRRVVITERLGLPADFPVLPAFIEGDYLQILVARVD